MQKIIALSGKIKSGKDTVADIIQQNTHNRFVIKKFAERLKRVVSTLTETPLEMNFTQEGKNILVSEIGLTIGQLQQKVGEGLRNVVDNDIWIKLLFTDTDERDWLITDLRYKGESHFLKSKGAILIRINPSYPGYSATNGTRDPNHSSEIDLDDYTGWDYVIENSGSLEELESKVSEVLKNINI
jgi:hypothetical protein